MGVPKFYRWISERYTKINEIVSDSALLPEFDHLYLDMNGIIHGCTHPSHMDVSDVLSERDMMLGIMHYLDRIVTQIVKPKVSVYMAIDGVAPRAKLNQQRSRRFRSAKDMGEATKDMPTEMDEDGNKKSPHVFDSNCITPGTEFLAKVSETIKYFIRKKLKEDPSWRNLKIIFSGHELPGEGEHKIMEHIRMMKNQPGYRPNTRHCIYGQDADLIMLGLVTHEPHFTILREVIDFQSGFANRNALKQVKKQVKESGFQLLHLSVLREYLHIEFCKEFPGADLERTIDDFVFMTFLVGNDFLPHLNTLDIGEGAFDFLFQIYKDQRHAWGAGNYLTKSGDISDPARLETFLVAIGSNEQETLEQREVGDAEFLKKKRKWNKRDGKADLPSDAELQAAEGAKQGEYQSMIRSVLTENSNATFVDGWNPKDGAKDFKGRYYYEKLKLTPLDIQAHHSLRQSYIEGLMWCLAYYYRGCISWGWFYPYHYGPMLSDLRQLPAMFERIKFEVGTPILPFQQLMSCLPPASATLVPKPYQYLMSSPDSPILEFYPTDFEVDMNGKKNPWEGVNLLPFIEINRLLNAIGKYCPDERLTPVELARNTKGKIYCYTYDLTCNDTVSSPNKGIGLIDITNCNSRVSIVPEYESDGVSFKPEIMPGTQIPYPGYPSLNVLPIAETELVPIGVNVFGMASKYPTTVLKLHEMPQIPPVEQLANNVLGKSLFINWPMMHEAKVVAISDDQTEVRQYKGKNKVKKLNKVESDRWQTDSQSMMQGYFAGRSIPGSGGVQIGEIRVRLKLLPLQGMKTNRANGATKKVFGKEEADVPLQLALWQSPAPDPRFIEKGPMKLEDRFPVTSNVILTKGKYRGCVGNVVGVSDDKKVGVKVLTMPPEIPFGLALARSVYESYISSSDAARILKLHPGLFGKITGIMMFEPGKYDLGLNLKSNEGLCVAGFTRQKKTKENNQNSCKKAWDSGDSVLVIGSERTIGNDDGRPTERIIWEYTPKAIRLVNEYRQKFPQLFTALIRMPNEKKYDATKVFGPNGADWLPVIRDWLNSAESSKLPRTPISTDTMSKEAVVAVEKAANVRNLAIKKKGFPKESLVKIPGTALYLENSTSATDVMNASDHNDDEAPELGDRIVNLCASGVPFGARGTVVGIHQATTGCVEVVMDEEFVGGTNLQGLCSNFRGKLCVWAHLMRITVDNSSSIVDKMVPQGSGKAAVDKILSDIEKQVKTQTGTSAAQPSEHAWAPPPPPPPIPAPPATPQNVSAPRSASAMSAGRAASSGKQRAGSAGRDKQAGWQQARGPPEKGIGFKSANKPKKNGLTRWKNIVTGKAQPPKPAASGQKAADLKKMLGVGKPASAPNAADLKAMLGVGTASQPPAAKAAELKAMLGVGSSTPAPPAASQGASAGLKAMLGVGSNQNPVPQPQLQPQMNNGFPPPPPSAADKLLQLMSKQQPPQIQHMPQAPMPMQPSFNFTYVEEGKEALPLPQAPMQHMGFPPPPVPMMMPGYGPPMHPMQMPMHHPGVPVPGHHVGTMPPQNMPRPPPPPSAPPVVSDEEFPPLSNEEFPSLGGSAPKVQASVPKPAEPTSGAPTTKQKMMVPSNVKSK